MKGSCRGRERGRGRQGVVPAGHVGDNLQEPNWRELVTTNPAPPVIRKRHLEQAPCCPGLYGFEALGLQ